MGSYGRGAGVGPGGRGGSAGGQHSTRASGSGRGPKAGKTAEVAPVGMVVGLGNPGSEYAGTRHNAGFLAIDELARQLGASYWKTKPGAMIAEVTLGAGASVQGGGPRKVVLVKPQAFMNCSGGPVKKLAEEYHVPAAGILVIHDELEIDAGAVRVRMGGGHAGHNGLRSLCDKLGTHDFPRVRVGIGRPPGRMAPADFVLKELRGRDLEDFQVTVADAASAVLCAVEQGLSAALSKFAGK